VRTGIRLADAGLEEVPLACVPENLVEERKVEAEGVKGPVAKDRKRSVDDEVGGDQ
jgi:hypothetical protein